MSITPAQCRAARALLAISQDELVRRCGVAKRTLAGFEAGSSNPIRANMAAIRQALESAGVEFIGEAGDRDLAGLHPLPVLLDQL